MIDATRLGELTAQVMDALQDYDEADEWKVETVAVIVELDSPTANQFVVKCSETRAWVMEAFLSEALGAVQCAREEIQEEPDG